MRPRLGPWVVVLRFHRRPDRFARRRGVGADRPVPATPADVAVARRLRTPRCASPRRRGGSRPRSPRCRRRRVRRVPGRRSPPGRGARMRCAARDRARSATGASTNACNRACSSRPTSSDPTRPDLVVARVEDAVVAPERVEARRSHERRHRQAMEAGERQLVADGRCVLRAPAHVVRDLRSGAVIGFETVAERARRRRGPRRDTTRVRGSCRASRGVVGRVTATRRRRSAARGARSGRAIRVGTAATPRATWASR